MPLPPNCRPAGLGRDPDQIAQAALERYRAKLETYLTDAGEDAPDAMERLVRRMEELGAWDPTWDNPPRRSSVRAFSIDLTNPGNPRVLANLVPAILTLEREQEMSFLELESELVESV